MQNIRTSICTSILNSSLTLGSWKHQFHSLRGTWHSYYHTPSNMVYVKNAQYSTWSCYTSHGTLLKPHSEDPTFTPNAESVPIKVTKYKNGQLHHTPAATAPPPKPQNTNTTWTYFLTQQEIWIQELIKNTFFTSIVEVIANIQTANSLIAVSDGSAKMTHMTFGWILSDTGGNRIIKGYGRCNGEASSMQAEAAGILAVSIFIGMIQK